MAEEALPTFAPDQVMSDEADFDFEDKVGVEQDLSGDGGCKKTILKAGEGWEKPEKGDEVTVHYVGTLLDGTKFDSSRDRGEPFTFQLGEGRVIKGWDAGVATMKKGETANLVCRSDYAYGAAGSPPTIPPDATLQFEVELISWKSVKDITGDGGVIKTVVNEGQGWQNPKDQDEVVITYTARLRPAAVDSATKCKTAAEQGLPVVAQSPEGGLTFYIGEAPCSGFAVALKNMKPKESALVLLKPEYAAGMAEVPADQVLEVQLQLTELHQISTPAPGVSKKTLLEPEGSWNKPNDGSTVSISVTTKSADGATVYEPEKDVTFTTDEEQVPEGLELAISSMKAEEHAIITVTDPVLFRAPEGAVAGTSVPADATAVVYDVVLKSFQKAKEKWEMNNQEKLESALARKEKGNAAYKARNLVRAARQYNAAVEAATSINERDYSPNPVAESASSSTNYVAQAKEVKKTCMNNWAAVELKRKNWAEAAKQATKVLELEPSNMKALYRRAQARIGLGELVEAEVDIRAGLLSEPDNTDLQALQRKLKVQMRELNKKEAKLYGKMFAALGKATAAAAEQDNAAPMEAEEQQQPSAAAAPVVEATA